jgi:hypothetical protein
LGHSPNAAAFWLIASLAASSGSESGTTGSIPPRLTGRPRGATLKPETGFFMADLGTRQA